MGTVTILKRLVPLRPSSVVDWAVGRWKAEVANRPLQNVHRRALDTTWRQVIRQYGGDPDILCGPAHDELVSTVVQEGLEARRELTDGQLNDFCKEPPCASDACRQARVCLHS